MPSLQLELGFDCAECEGSLSVTVECRGKGLAAGPRTVAAVKIPCPTCGQTNRVCFHPTEGVGMVVAVDRVEQPAWVPQFSLN